MKCLVLLSGSLTASLGTILHRFIRYKKQLGLSTDVTQYTFWPFFLSERFRTVCTGHWLLPCPGTLCQVWQVSKRRLLP